MRHRIFIEFGGISHNSLTNYKGTKSNFTKRSLDNTPIIKQSNWASSVTDWNLVPPDRQWWEFLLKMLESEWVQLLIRVWFFAICSTPAFPVHHNSQSLFKLMSIKSVMPSNHLILCHPLLLPPSIFPSIRVFFCESLLHIRWPKYWSFNLSISPSNEYSGLISFMIDWLELLAVQGTFKSLLQHHSSKAPILQGLAFFIVQLSYPYMTTGKTIALTRWLCWQSNVSAF